MGAVTKRAHQKFSRRIHDAYDTPESAVRPLLPHLAEFWPFSWYEPCAGSGALVSALEVHGFPCAGASDIRPRATRVRQLDATTLAMAPADMFITNPPWSRPALHDLIDRLSAMAPTWLLFDADWAHTQQARPFSSRCRKIVSVGRVSWMGNGVSGFDNCAWYLFDCNEGSTEFVFR